MMILVDIRTRKLHQLKFPGWLYAKAAEKLTQTLRGSESSQTFYRLLNGFSKENQIFTFEKFGSALQWIDVNSGISRQVRFPKENGSILNAHLVDKRRILIQSDLNSL